MSETNNWKFDHPYMYTSKEQRSLSQQYMYSTYNSYQGMFITDSEFNLYDDEGKTLLLHEESAFERVRELIEYNIFIGSRKLFDELDIVNNPDVLGKTFPFMVAPEFHDVDSTITIHDDYPTVRIFKSYFALIEYIEAQNYKFEKRVVFIGDIDALQELKYLTNSIELMTLEDKVNTVGNYKFPIKYINEHMAFSKLHKREDMVFRTIDEDAVEAEREETENLVNVDEGNFSNFIKFSKSTKDRVKKTQEIINDGTHEFQIYRMTRKTLKNFYNMKAKFVNQIDEGLPDKRDELRIMRIGDYAIIFNLYKMVTRDIIKLEDYLVNDVEDDWSNETFKSIALTKVAPNKREVVHSVAITISQITNFELDNEIPKWEFKNLCMEYGLQIQER